MKAYHKYKQNKYRGKTISDREKARRIAHSQGWRMTLMDMPLSWFEFMKKGGFEFDNLLDQVNQMNLITTNRKQENNATEFVDVPVNRGEAVETKTLQL
jgi:hypothetical protein